MTLEICSKVNELMYLNALWMYLFHSRYFEYGENGNFYGKINVKLLRQKYYKLVELYK